MYKVTVNGSRCKGCGLCVSVCPKKIMKLSEDKLNKKGFSPAEVKERKKCIGCTFCAVICPDSAVMIEKLPDGGNDDE